MGIFDRLGNISPNGAIDTQVQTMLGVERVLIALRENATGLASLLMTIEFIGAILTVIYSAFLICLIALIYLLMFFIGLYKQWRYPSKKFSPADDGVEYKEITDEEEEDIYKII